MAAHEDLTTHLQTHTCTHDDPSDQHPDITSLTLHLHLPPNLSDTRIGILQSHLLTTNPSNPDLWTSCRALDRAHAPTAKLHKIENYLSNECFLPNQQALLDRAAWVLYVDAVYLRPEWRGRGWGMEGVRRLVGEVVMMNEGEGVVLLEPGPVGVRGEWAFEVEAPGVQEGGEGDATERLARYWMRMGFEAWSYTDEAWLCLSTEHMSECQESSQRRGS